MSIPSARSSAVRLGASARAPARPPRSALQDRARASTSALSPIRGIDACPALPWRREREAEHALLGDARPGRRAGRRSRTSRRRPRSPRSRSAPCPGICSHSHFAPWIAPASSSAVTITSSSPDSGRQPSSASVAARRAISAATWLFMSSAPRPQTQPSLQLARPRVHASSRRRRRARCPRGRGSTAPGRRSGRAGARPGSAALGTSASSSHSKPAASSSLLEELLRGLLVAGRVDRVELDQPLEQLGGPPLEVRLRPSTRASIRCETRVCFDPRASAGAHRAARSRAAAAPRACGRPTLDEFVGQEHSSARARRCGGRSRRAARTR